MFKRYTCPSCSYLYDPEAGDPEYGVSPGTAFNLIPSDWTCPICGAFKKTFEVDYARDAEDKRNTFK